MNKAVTIAAIGISSMLVTIYLSAMILERNEDLMREQLDLIEKCSKSIKDYSWKEFELNRQRAWCNKSAFYKVMNNPPLCRLPPGNYNFVYK